MKQVRILIIGILLSTFYFLLSFPAFAAELYLEPSRSEYALGETFFIDVRLNVTPPENINAVEAYLKYPTDIISLKDISIGNSILTFISQPEIDEPNGLIHFSGIIPSGYIGQIPGNPDLNNLLLKISFKMTGNIIGLSSSNIYQISFMDKSQAFLNDGQGTPAKLILKPAQIIIAKEAPILSLDSWQNFLQEDKTPPEDFKPELVEINGKYYLLFLAQDKESGIDYYEAQETKTDKLDDFKWQKAESPYLINDQTLTSYIYIRAIDKAHNIRLAVFIPSPSVSPVKPHYENLFIWFIIFISLISLVLLYFIMRYIWGRKSNIGK